MNKEQKEAAIACFKLDKNLQEVTVTEDNNCFTSANLMQNHVRERGLNKDATVTISRAEVMPNEGEEPNGTQADADGGAQQGKPLSKMNKPELLAEVAKREGLVAPEGLTNKDLIKLIEDFDAGIEPAAEEKGEGA